VAAKHIEDSALHPVVTADDRQPAFKSIRDGERLPKTQK
jgi:hypothetical protein